MTWIDTLLDEYYKWLRDKTFTQQDDADDWVLINTPFVGMYNDMIELYAKKKEGKIFLSDNGKTLSDLELIGVNMNRSTNRRSIVEKIVRTHGIRLNTDNGELSIEADNKTFSQKKHDLISAIIDLNDLYVLSSGTIASVFKEDVELFLQENNIVYTPNFIARGSTGLEFMFDFQIAGLKKEIVIKAFNTTNRINTLSFLFSWDDIRENRELLTKKNVSAVAILNDSQEKNIKKDFVDAMKNKGAQIVLWTKKTEPEYFKYLEA